MTMIYNDNDQDEGKDYNFQVQEEGGKRSLMAAST